MNTVLPQNPIDQSTSNVLPLQTPTGADAGSSVTASSPNPAPQSVTSDSISNQVMPAQVSQPSVVHPSTVQPSEDQHSIAQPPVPVSQDSIPAVPVSSPRSGVPSEASPLGSLPASTTHDFPWKTEGKRKSTGKLDARSVGKIVGIIAVALLLGMFGLVIFFKGPTPTDIRISNLTDQSVTVSWTTEKPSAGAVIYKTKSSFRPLFFAKSNAEIAYDDRDVQEARLKEMDALVNSQEARDEADYSRIDSVKVTKKGRYYIHYVTLENIEPSTTYFFQVGNGAIFTSGGMKFATDNTINTTNTFTTYELSEKLMTPNPTYGSIVTGDDVVTDGVVFMIPNPGAEIGVLSAVLNSEGRWYIDLANARTTEGNAVEDFNESEDSELISVEAGPLGNTSEVEIQMSEDAPVRTIDVASSDDGEVSETESETDYTNANSDFIAQEGRNGLELHGEEIDSPDLPTAVPLTVTGEDSRLPFNDLPGKNRGTLSRVTQPAYAADITYTISDQYIIIPDATGVYDIVIPGEGVAEDVLLIEGEDYVFFYDTDGDGVWDEDEEQIVVEGLTVDLQIDDSIEAYEFDLEKGLNFVSFEYLPVLVDSCELIKELDNQSDRGVTQIARFESGVFEAVSFRRDLPDPPSGDCFPVVPGRGYVVKSVGTGRTGFSGYRLKKPAGVLLDTQGWHLIGVNGGTRRYTASSLLDSIDLVEGLDADNVTKWVTRSSKYEGLQKEPDELGDMMTYGFDFLIEPETGYFVRLGEAGAVWEPD